MTDHTPVPNASTDGTPRAGCWFFMLPVVLAVLIFGAYIVLFGVGSMGSAAAGDRVQIDFDTCADARPLIEGRVEQMGLGDPVWSEHDGGLRLVATLPATAAAPHIPATLARTGNLQVRAGLTATDPIILGPEHITKAELSLKELGNPLVEVSMNLDGKSTLESHMEDHIDGQISVWIDAEKVFERENDPPFRNSKMDLRAQGDDGVDNLRRAADWGMVMTHGPLPCEAKVASTTTLE
ncbi:MAG: hypothetical protein AB8H79_19555 [Myxococcota bacterium]